jgi:hypothetical protein
MMELVILVFCSAVFFIVGIIVASVRDKMFDDALMQYNCLASIEADLRYLKTDRYQCFIQKEHLRVGCEHHAWDKWLGFDDKRITEMDSGALEWWVVWKPILLSIRDTI